MSDLTGRTVFMSGGSRGIGLAIAEKLAQDGANVALLAKTDQPHPKLEGTIHTAAEAIEKAGGKALPIVGDVRDEDAVEAAVAQTVESSAASTSWSTTRARSTWPRSATCRSSAST